MTEFLHGLSFLGAMLPVAVIGLAVYLTREDRNP